MVIEPGRSEGGPANRDRGADQWLLVVFGRGTATVNGHRVALRAGDAMLIERRDQHQITNTGRTLLRTVNLYVPPAYTRSGSELPRAQP